MNPMAIDLFCGLGGWTDGLLAEGWRVVGFDIEVHDYGDGARYPAQLVVQDVMTLHGRQFKDAALIVASPPCQEFSYMAMPWSKAKEKQRKIEADTTGAERKRLTALFDACFRIQREACEAAGRHIPMVVENVRGAQKWVGRARWAFGSFFLWGDVPALMPIPHKAVKVAGMDWSKYGEADYKAIAFNGEAERRMKDEGSKVPGFRFDGSGKSFQTASVEGMKMPTGDATRTPKGRSAALANYDTMREAIKNSGDWFNAEQPSKQRRHGSRSKARKAASAAIAKIPFALSSHIARVWKPKAVAA